MGEGVLAFVDVCARERVGWRMEGRRRRRGRKEWVLREGRCIVWLQGDVWCWVGIMYVVELLRFGFAVC